MSFGNITDFNLQTRTRPNLGVYDAFNSEQDRLIREQLRIFNEERMLEAEKQARLNQTDNVARDVLSYLIPKPGAGRKSSSSSGLRAALGTLAGGGMKGGDSEKFKKLSAYYLNNKYPGYFTPEGQEALSEITYGSKPIDIEADISLFSEKFGYDNREELERIRKEAANFAFSHLRGSLWQGPGSINTGQPWTAHGDASGVGGVTSRMMPGFPGGMMYGFPGAMYGYRTSQQQSNSPRPPTPEEVEEMVRYAYEIARNRHNPDAEAILPPDALKYMTEGKRPRATEDYEGSVYDGASRVQEALGKDQGGDGEEKPRHPADAFIGFLGSMAGKGYDRFEDWFARKSAVGGGMQTPERMNNAIDWLGNSPPMSGQFNIPQEMIARQAETAPPQSPGVQQPEWTNNAVNALAPKATALTDQVLDWFTPAPATPVSEQEPLNTSGVQQPEWTNNAIDWLSNSPPMSGQFSIPQEMIARQAETAPPQSPPVADDTMAQILLSAMAGNPEPTPQDIMSARRAAIESGADIPQYNGGAAPEGAPAQNPQVADIASPEDYAHFLTSGQTSMSDRLRGMYEDIGRAARNELREPSPWYAQHQQDGGRSVLFSTVMSALLNETAPSGKKINRSQANTLARIIATPYASPEHHAELGRELGFDSYEEFTEFIAEMQNLIE